MLRGLTQATLCTRTQNPPKNVGTVLAFPFDSYLKIEAAIFMFVTCKLNDKVLKIHPIRSNPVKFFWLVIRCGSGQNDPNPVRFRFGQNFRSGPTLVQTQFGGCCGVEIFTKMCKKTKVLLKNEGKIVIQEKSLTWGKQIS